MNKQAPPRPSSLGNDNGHFMDFHTLRTLSVHSTYLKPTINHKQTSLIPREPMGIRLRIHGKTIYRHDIRVSSLYLPGYHRCGF
ncbi:hypothetical protein METHP15_1720002 [Pseudomonas sp. P15-2025]